jgi:hypothetical protein
MRIRTVVALAAIATSACRTVSQGTTEGHDGGSVVEGRVERVIAEDTSVTVLDRSAQEEVVLIAPDAEVRIDDFKASFKDIQEGQRVRASLDEVDGVQQVVRIEILDKAVPASGVRRRSGGRRRHSGPGVSQLTRSDRLRRERPPASCRPRGARG